ncbi:hypothetical protein QJR30_18015 (plasmid) [Paraclostridium sordellii]|nr:hypothetical protein [Paeniclostridium sordellii]CEP41298.1 Uncharacterised protein [[Clostridium] sordellii] [Paeniclostridium sordellii]
MKSKLGSLIAIGLCSYALLTKKLSLLVQVFVIILIILVIFEMYKNITK